MEANKVLQTTNHKISDRWCSTTGVRCRSGERRWFIWGPRGLNVLQQAPKPKGHLKRSLQVMPAYVRASATISVVQRTGWVSHSCLFRGLIHVVLQGLMKRQPLLHRGLERENPPAMKSRHLRTTQPLARAQADSGHQDSLSL